VPPDFGREVESFRRIVPMPDSPLHLLAAFTSNGLLQVDSRLKSARHLVMVDLTATRATITGIRALRSAEGIEAGLLFTLGLDQEAALRLQRGGCFPVTLEQPQAIGSVVGRLQELMRHDPPLWLCRRLRRAGPPPCQPPAAP